MKRAKRTIGIHPFVLLSVEEKT